LEEAVHTISNIQYQYTKYGIGRWATIEKSTGNFIGWSGLKFITEIENKQFNFYDIGYRYIPKYWGKGYATEATKAILGFGFNTMQLDRIVGKANEENKASIRVLEKCGLKFIEKYYWKEIRCDWLEITGSEWKLLNSTQR